MTAPESKITVTYSGEMTPEIAAYLEQVERVMNETFDADKLVNAANAAAIELHAFGATKIAEHEFLRKEKA